METRRSARLPKYDYGKQGVYFVTLCTYQRQCTLSTVGRDKVNCGNAAREGALGYDLGAPFVNHLHTRNHRGAQCAPKNRLILHCVGAQYAPYGVTCTNRLIRFTLSKIEKGLTRRVSPSVCRKSSISTLVLCATARIK